MFSAQSCVRLLLASYVLYDRVGFEKLASQTDLTCLLLLLMLDGDVHVGTNASMHGCKIKFYRVNHDEGSRLRCGRRPSHLFPIPTTVHSHSNKKERTSGIRQFCQTRLELAYAPLCSIITMLLSPTIEFL